MEDLPPPTDPWMITLYKERPQLARRLDQWNINIAAACGRVFVRHEIPYYSNPDPQELRELVHRLNDTNETEWERLLWDYSFCYLEEVRLVNPDVYRDTVDRFDGLQERIAAYKAVHPKGRRFMAGKEHIDAVET